MLRPHSYCRLHDTYPHDEEPCWACVHYFCDITDEQYLTEPARLLEAAKQLVEKAMTICSSKSNN
jgi:hypothetical protein